MPSSRASDPELPLRLTLPNDESSIETARRAVLDRVAGCDLPPRALYRLELVIEEVLMNIVMHAFPQCGVHSIQFELEIEPDALVLCFEDDGLAFDPLLAPAPSVATSIGEAVPGGFGLFLTRKSARSLEYARVGGRNRLTVHLSRAMA